MSIFKTYRAHLIVALSVVFLLVLVRSVASFDILLADRWIRGVGWAQIGCAALFSFVLYGALITPARAPRWRRVTWVLFCAVFFLQLVLGLVVSPLFLMSGELHFPIPMVILGGAVYRWELAFMPILFLTTVVLSGPAWCSQLCYMGGADLFFSERRTRGAARVVRPVRGRWFFRAGSLLLVIATALLLSALGASAWLVVTLTAVWGVVGWAVVLLLSPGRRQMVHCNLFCPMGAVVSLLRWANPARLRFDTVRCVRCMDCAKVCRYGAITGADLKVSRPAINCTMCGDCFAACGHGAVEYRFLGLGPRSSRAVYVAVVTVLYVLFLNLARI